MWKEIIASPKGQITLPSEMREILGIMPGDTILISVDDGKLVLTPKNLDFNDLAGFLGEPPNGPATLDELNETIAREMAESAIAPNKQFKDFAA
ncbi:MAG: AbrB/MazE/SpoVT family DNA-binding domain-containing protein [Rhizobiaceae bacterium]|nr:AbrB/MazE/SpoVT family DNA-binding domain-containing protein [Rhizobiaceae bacterium]